MSPHNTNADPPASKPVTLVCVLEQRRYRPGDPAPEGYLAWHEWAEAQHKAGLRQKQCGRCGLWRYPQQLSTEVLRWQGKTARGKTVQQEAPVCSKCAAHPNGKTTDQARDQHGITP
ncbi:hypothetical protein JI742_10000 [Piscinibacter sp. Jin2]|uniref:Uncharacterized protein n=1 Tax=Aquariibacter lacus TaxID=2801332 RepID=A0A9X0XDE4_9BURK|nr:hypothetical protein [Piscinibacter lacus]MBL0720222.1 hypothetical protein [Piscinibacter lacus]